ncbi:MAG: insulinase family protein [Oligoflexia bacterium]|nr:insulinase family protein [Oligoflexia bacterium]
MSTNTSLKQHWLKFGAFLAAALILTLSACSNQQKLVRPDALALGLQGSSYRPITPETWNLPNGLTVMFMQDNELPLVQGTLYLKGGGLWESDDVLGATSAMGDQMRQGGAGELDADDLDTELEKLAANISSGFAGENGKVSFSCLESDFDRVFSLFSDVVLRPRFAQSRLDLLKGQSLDAIKRRVEDPSTVAQLSFGQLLYGKSAFGRVATDSDVRRLTREDIVRMHRLLVQPKRAVLVLSGKIERAKAQQAIERLFSEWQPREEELSVLPTGFVSAEPGIYFIELPFEQSTIIMGHLGVPRFTPDYAAIDAFNDIFGSSGFGSRLMARVRTQLGLAYSVFGMIQPGFVQGKNFIMLQTKSESSGLALSESLGVVRKIQTGGITAQELAESQRAIVNSFVFRFDSTDEVAQRAALFKVLEYPQDYDTTYVERIMGLTTAQVEEVGTKHWDLSKFVIVVVGNETAYNSIQALVTGAGSPIHGLRLQKVKFDQKLLWP